MVGLETSQANTFGLCVNQAITVHRYAEAGSEQVTQLIFGDTYQVLQTTPDGQWLYIQNQFDQYEGWIAKQYEFEISAWYFEQVQAQNFPVCADLDGVVLWNEKEIPISFGSTLPFYENGFLRLGSEEAQFKGNTLVPPTSLDIKKLIENAYQWLDIPYLWGGKSCKGIDCSGFVQVLHKVSGYNLPRDSYQQAEIGIPVTLDEVQEGDLAFFVKEGRIFHVGILLGNGKIIHATGFTGTVRIDTFDEKGIYNEEKEVYSHLLGFVRRLD